MKKYIVEKLKLGNPETDNAETGKIKLEDLLNAMPAERYEFVSSVPSGFEEIYLIFKVLK